MKLKIVKLNIKTQDNWVKTYYLLNPNKQKLATIKDIIEYYDEYANFGKKFSWEEFEIIQEIEGKGYIEGIDFIINTSFTTLGIEKTYDIMCPEK